MKESFEVQFWVVRRDFYHVGQNIKTAKNRSSQLFYRWLVRDPPPRWPRWSDLRVHHRHPVPEPEEVRQVLVREQQPLDPIHRSPARGDPEDDPLQGHLRQLRPGEWQPQWNGNLL